MFLLTRAPLLCFLHQAEPVEKKSTGKKAAVVGKSGKKLTGFMKFSKEKRETVKAENEGITFGQIGKKLGELWRGLDDDEKAKYNN
ncbi:hypothetical protein T492DRAFT_589480 [Pavlovales sp. CCMP2436]|nr:hypothetical protein T492DRAFT_589480 [Pavlovales sp. CCMP2436]